MKYIAVIPARGGSKRLPGKNIKEFCGKPLIYYSIVSAIRCKSIDSVFVSTDDLEIAEVATRYGAEVIIRPDSLSTDTSTTSSVLCHVLNHLDALGFNPEAIVTLQVTNPLRSINLIENAIKIFEEKKDSIDSVITVSENKHKLGKILNGYFKPFFYNLEQRSQDIEKLYFENGLLYITKSVIVLQNESVFGDKVHPFITDNIFGMIDIDTLSDFELGELVFEKYKQEFNF